MHTDGHDMGKDTVGSNAPLGAPAPQHGPGYETTDVNVGGVVVFLGGLVGFLLIFFLFCFGMGKVINNAIGKRDGDVDKWHQASSFQGAKLNGGKRQDLASNPEMQQKALQQITATFPTPRLELDDGNQETADLHAQEDLLLNHYSMGENGAVRIPIERAMELIVERGLAGSGKMPTGGPELQAKGGEAKEVQMAGTPAKSKMMAGEDTPVLQPPLTSGFARTGFELDTMETRAQRLSFGKAEAQAGQQAPRAK